MPTLIPLMTETLFWFFFFMHQLLL